MKPWKIVSCAIVLGALSSISPAPAVAAPIVAAAGAEQLSGSAQPLVNVQYRRWHHRHHGHGWRHRHHYCSQRYRSYDPASGTYLGYDGNRHPCP